MSQSVIEYYTLGYTPCAGGRDCRFFVLFSQKNLKSIKAIQQGKELTKMKTKTIVILLLAIMLVFAAACDSADSSPGQQPDANLIDAPSNAQSIGEGATAFIFEVTDGDGNVSVWNVRTNETTVGDALVGVGLIEGDLSDFGLMVTHVNGLRADFTEDGAWWAFYIDGEMAMVGVDSTDIEEGASYAFVYTPA